MQKYIRFLLLAFASSLIIWLAAEPAQAQVSAASFKIVSQNHAEKKVTVRASVFTAICTPTGLWRYTWGDTNHTDIGHSITSDYTHTYANWGTYTITLHYDCHGYSQPKSTAIQITLSEPTATPTPSTTPSPTPVLTVSFSTLTYLNRHVYIITQSLPGARAVCQLSGAVNGTIICPPNSLVSVDFNGCGEVTVTAKATLGSQTSYVTGKAANPCAPAATNTPPATGSANISNVSQSYLNRSVTVDVTQTNCTGTGTWSIDWGDGDTSDVASPYTGQFSHSYADWGLYDITLTYTCQGGNQSEAKAAVGFDHPTATPTNTPAPRQANSGAGARRGAATWDDPCLPAGVSVNSATPGISYCAVGDAEVGVDWIIEAGYMEAIDFWDPDGAQVQANVCFDGVGALLLLDAAYTPRRPVWLLSTLRYGKTCTQLDREGTLIFMPGNPTFMLQTATPTVSGQPASHQNADHPDLMRPLENCLVNSVTALNFRAQPGGRVLGRYGGRSVAVARTPNWFKVQYLGREGWISAHYVTTEGDCG